MKTQTTPPALKEKIKKEILFLSDHWTQEDKMPFNFGGWLDEVVGDLYKIFQEELEASRKEVLEKIEDLRITREKEETRTTLWNARDYNHALDDLLQALGTETVVNRSFLVVNELSSDLLTFEHGEESPPYACKEIMDKHAGKIICCGCVNHKCQPAEEQEEE